MSPIPYPRDLRGYGANPPHARWPGGARIAVQFVLNYEEGGENNVLHGDPTSETFLSELVTAQAYENRHMTMESMYEYGSRVGVWRLLREFDPGSAGARDLDVPDPYYRGPDGFADVFDLVYAACAGLLAQIASGELR